MFRLCLAARRLSAAVVATVCAALLCSTAALGQTAVMIHDVMQSLPGGPYLGTSVTTSGIVVGVLSTGGFYLSEPSNAWDGLVSTAEGMPVFVSTVSGCTGVADGDVLTVTGTVVNGTATTAANTPGTGIQPTACTKTGTAAMTQSIDLANFGALTSFGDALKFSGMAATDRSFVAIGPTAGALSGTGTGIDSNGQFWAVLSANITTNNHLFRGAGIAPDEYTPAGAPSGVPTWAGNPQRILIDTTTFGGNPVNITVGQTITCANANTTGKGATAGIGLIDYTPGYARLLIFKETTCTVSGTVATSVSAAADTTHFKVGTLDVSTFLGSASLFSTALAKATLTVTDVFGSPDIFALQQVGQRDTLQALADAVNAANGGSTNYVPLVPGTDLVNSGFLVNTNTLKNMSVSEVGRVATYMSASGAAVLWDHPPVVVRGEFARVGSNYPVTVIDVDMLPRDNSGDAALGADIRARRAAQAAAVSQMVQTYQLANANVIVAGNFNSYEYNDGYVDVLGVVKGSPAAAANVTTYQATSTTAPLTDFTTQVVANTRYNVIERGNAASIEHILASATVTDATTASAALASYVNVVTQPHFSADYAAVTANDATTPAGLTPHDGFLVNFAIPPVPTTATLTPVALNFGDVEIGGGTRTLQLTLTNTSSFAPATINVSSIAISGTNAAEFAFTDNCTVLTEGGSCTLQVTFAPTAVGTRTGTITVKTDSTSDPSLTASLSGNGIDTTATLTPTAYTFPATSVTDTSAAKIFTFANTSKQAALTVGAAAVTGDYVIASNTCTAPVAVGGTCSIGVVFKPAVSGVRGGLLTVPNSSSADAVLTASLSGTGVDTTATLTPLAAAFPNTYAGGGVSAAQTFTVTNTSQVAIAVKGAAVSANFNVTANNCPATLLAGASCTVLVAFAPATAGALTGTLTVTDGSTANPVLTAALTGTGLATTAVLTPAAQNFGNVVLGSTSASFPFVYRNTSAIPLTVTAAVATGDFRVSASGCATVAAGASCTIGVVLTPSVLGARTGTLTVSSSASANPALLAALTGRGVADVEANAAALDFGTVDVGAHSAAQVVTITNYTAAPISLTSLAVLGDYADGTTCGAVLPGLSSCTVTIVFTPTAVGVRPGTLVVTTNDTKYPLITVLLTGSGADFSLAMLPASGNMVAGNGTVTTTVTATALGGFNAPITMTCTFLAVASTCTLPNGSFTLSGTTAQRMAITTTSQYTVVGYGVAGSPRAAGLVLALGAAALLALARRRMAVRVRLLGICGACLLVLGGLSGCSGKYPDLNSPYTEPGSYTYTVTATDGTVSHTATYTLAVRAR